MQDRNVSSVRTKCIIYCRVSSLKQTSDGAGLSSQERTCRDYAERSGYEVVAVYTDVISGKATERPGMNALLALLKRVNGPDFVVVVDDVARFARDVSAHAALRTKIVSSGARIETPKQKLGEDPNSRFLEFIMAAVAALDRESNAERSMSRSVARLHNGYWVFAAPKGYRYAKAPGGGKMLVRDEPVASIIAEALNGFASGRFQTQGEVKRFLDGKSEYPKDYRGTEVRFDSVAVLLKHVIYAGYLEKQEWGVPLTKAKHEPLIDYATHLAIQQRLAEKSVAPVRKDIDKDFPLRGFLVCDACGHRLTSCWSKSHTGQKYPYYLCQYRRCGEKGKSTGQAQVEVQFESILQAVEPDPSTFELAARMFRDAWEQRSFAAVDEEKRLRIRSKQIDREIKELLDRIVRTQSEVTVAAYEQRIIELQSERASVDEEAAKAATPAGSFDDLFELSMRFLASPYEIWRKGDLAVKRTVLRLVFAQPLGFSRETGVRTAETTYPFKVIRFLSSSDCKVVPPDGLEPPTF